MPLQVTYQQVIAHRMRTHHLTSRLPSGSYAVAARFALQDSAPRSALLSLHARVDGCAPSAWADPRLIQTYSPRAAVHVLPRADLGVFTLGRLPRDSDARAAIEDMAERICRALDGRELRIGRLPQDMQGTVRPAAASGRLAVCWTTSSLSVREVPLPTVDLYEARLELCRRHLHAYGPSTPVAFAWWAGMSTHDARQTWLRLEPELLSVEIDGHPAAILAADEPALLDAPEVHGVRLLPAEERRLFGSDRTGLFVAPEWRGSVRPYSDWFHPHVVVVDGKVVGAWGRRKGRVMIRVGEGLSPRVRTALEAEALAFPIPGATMRVELTELPGPGEQPPSEHRPTEHRPTEHRPSEHRPGEQGERRDPTG
jgi:hypothetical protein